MVPLDSLVHKHLDRLLDDNDIQQQIDRLASLNGGPLKIKFLFKYGLDGSSEGPRFKQALQDITSRDQGHCLATQMVPLQLVTVVQNKVHLIWHNWWCEYTNLSLFVCLSRTKNSSCFSR